MMWRYNGDTKKWEADNGMSFDGRSNKTFAEIETQIVMLESGVCFKN